MSTKNGKDKIPFYEKKTAYRNAGIMSLIGCVLMLSATFLHWIFVVIKTAEVETGGTTIFKAVSSGIKSGVRIGTLVPVLLLVLYYAAVLFLGYLGVMDNIVRMPIIKEEIKKYYDLRDSWKKFIESARGLGANMGSHLFPGLGKIALVLGILAFFAAIVYNFVLDTLNEDESDSDTSTLS